MTRDQLVGCIVALDECPPDAIALVLGLVFASGAAPALLGHASITTLMRVRSGRTSN